MSADSRVFVAWEERVISQERGNRVVHFYLKDSYGDYVLAVVGTERSIRHMMYVASDEFLQICGSKKVCTKWRARRDVIDWLTTFVSRHCPALWNSGTNDTEQALASLKLSRNEFRANTSHLQDQMIQFPRKWKVRTSKIVWSGTSWICCKQLKHYPAFSRNGTTIAVHSFVFVMSEEGTHYLGYLEDLYQDKKGKKRARVRWFYHKKDVESIISQLNPHPREVFITPHAQVISAECIDGPAAVLTPKHYDKCLALVPHTFSSVIYTCFRQLKNNEVQPFTLTKLRGYSNQAILSCLDSAVFNKHKTKCLKDDTLEENDATDGDLVKRDIMKEKKYSASWVQMINSDSERHNLKFRLLTRPTGIKLVKSEPQIPIIFMVNDKIELLCQDSGIRGCWFRCKVLRTCQKHLKVQYEDVVDVDGSGNLEEWVAASRVASPDKLGMRCSGRLTTRPRPPADPSIPNFELGAPVDAWWNDGWWEGIVSGFDTAVDGVDIYFPGEDMFLTIQRENIRISRDWVSNRWVDIKANTEVLSRISQTTCPSKKSPMCSTIIKASDCMHSEIFDCKYQAVSKHEAVEEEQQEHHAFSTHEDSTEVERRVQLRKRCRVNDGGKNCGNHEGTCYGEDDYFISVGNGVDDNEENSDYDYCEQQ